MNVKSSYMVLGGTAVIGLGLGLIAGYFFADKQLEAEYADISEKEIAEAKHFYSALNKRGRYSTPESVVKDRGIKEPENTGIKAVREINEATRAMRDYRGEHRSEPKPDPENTPESGSGETFVVGPDGFDFEEEEKARTTDAPYIITKEEFFDNEKDYDQVTLTYFVNDDVIVDEQEVKIDDTDAVLGDENLLRFGHGSGDRHVVYIRNDRLTLEAEVVIDMNSYQEKMLGFVSHSNDRSSRKRNKKTKFKGGDDE